MLRPDLRASLREVAAGRGIDELPNSLNPTDVAKQQPAFRAWVAFAKSSQGEPLTAPAELLAPTP